jgi:FkbM family methyltransferase
VISRDDAVANIRESWGDELQLKAALRTLLGPILYHPPVYRWRRELRRGRWKEQELGLLPFIVDPGRLAIDVGANSGVYVHELLRLGAPVLAVEANPGFAAHLRRYYGRRARIEQAAASDSPGEVRLRIPRVNLGLATVAASNALSGSDYDEVSVPAVTLDGLAARPVGFVKIDVEGHELAVLKGGAAMLRRDRPAILIEAEERHRAGAVESVRALLEPMGYRGFMLDGGRLVSIDRFDPHRDQAFDPGDLALLNAGRYPGRYINNFLFVA